MSHGGSSASGSKKDAILTTRAEPGTTRFEKPKVLREFYAGRELGQLIRFLVGKRRKQSPATESAAPADPVIDPFDQGTLDDRFRTNAYPTMAIDGNSRVYAAWSERGFRPAGAGAQLDASIVMTTSANGTPWTDAFAIDTHGNPGHQFMPSLAFGGGKLMLVFYDLREDTSGIFREFVDEASAIYYGRRRHTIDVRAAQASPGEVPAFAPSVLVSEYVVGSRPRSKVIEQLHGARDGAGCERTVAAQRRADDRAGLPHGVDGQPRRAAAE